MASFLLPCLFIVLAYLSGSVPWGLLLTRWRGTEDIRAQGSGNIGATNVTRVAGKFLGGMTLILDMLKGGIPVYWAETILRPNPWCDGIIPFVALAAFVGHLFPVFLGCRIGGKGVATALGCFLVISPAACAGALIIFILVFLCFRYVSVGSLSAVASLPFFMALAGKSPWTIGVSIVIAIGIFFRHASNLRRLMAGMEPKFGKSTK
jgi:acyl phosphate:glycerol-3-phosphate acyltransferase